MKHTILNGDVINCLRSLPDCSVQCVVTSPPYWGLRDYGVEGQIGLEPTPEEHVERMVDVFREVKRVLRDDGTVWLNYGDCYTTCFFSHNSVRSVPQPMGDWCKEGQRLERDKRSRRGSADGVGDLKPKDLVGMPWRIAFALQADGWYLRSDIIWSKPNPMPESVTDRPTKSHEYVFLLTKRPRYFYDADAIREEHKPESIARVNRTHHLPGHKWENGPGGQTLANDLSAALSPLGRNRRTVWEIPTQPTPEAHFATFPEALVEPCIKAGTSERGCCPECGAPWRRVVERKNPTRTKISGIGVDCNEGTKGRAGDMEIVTTGWAPSCTCGCEETVPCTVLDPFGGSGTVAKVARDLGRSSVSCELNPEYVKIAKKRLRIGEQLDSGVCEYVVTSLLTEG